MKIRYYFVVAILVFVTESKAQQRQMKAKPQGLYFGGKYFDKLYPGYYYFKNDSTFIYLGLAWKKESGYENSSDRHNPKRFFTDSMLCFGKGKWYLKDSFYTTEFEDMDNRFLDIRKDDVQYHSYSKYPYDTLFLKIHVTNFTPQTLGNASILFKEINIGAATDSMGLSEAKLPINLIKYPITVFKPGFDEKIFRLIPNNNVHEITFSLSPKNDSKVYLIGSTKIPYRAYDKKTKNKIQFWNDGRLFIAEKGDVKKLIEIVMKNYSITTEQKYLLDSILSELMLLKE